MCCFYRSTLSRMGLLFALHAADLSNTTSVSTFSKQLSGLILESHPQAPWERREHYLPAVSHAKSRCQS